MANVSSFSGAMPVIPGGLVETGYVQRTTNYTSTATTIAAATSAFSDLTFVADGGPYMVEVFFPQVSFTGAYTLGCFVNAAGTDLGQVIYVGPASASHGAYGSYRYTPSAGSVTINFRAATNTGTATYAGGAGGSGAYPPSFLRVSKIVNQNDGLKPVWTPPIVTQLPSQATVGDSVLYAADATNGVYWQLQYDGLGTYPWKFIGGPALYAYVDTDQLTASTTYADLATAGPSVTASLSGDYDVSWGARNWNSLTNNEARMGISFAGASVVEPDHMFNNFMGAGGSPAPGGAWTSSKTIRKTAFVGGAITTKYRSNPGGNSQFAGRFLSVLPVRVKAA